VLSALAYEPGLLKSVQLRFAKKTLAHREGFQKCEHCLLPLRRRCSATAIIIRTVVAGSIPSRTSAASTSCAVVRESSFEDQSRLQQKESSASGAPARYK
jgi:hypothetical protein